MHIGQGLSILSGKATSSEVDESRRTEHPTPSPAADKQSVAKQDVLSLSQGSSLLQQAMQSGSPGRDSRVAELRDLVQSGSYVVDAKAVSQSLVRELFGS